MSRSRRALAATLAAALLVLTACGGGADAPAPGATQPTDTPTSTSPTAEEAAGSHGGGHDAEPARSKKLRAGETRTTIAMPGS